MRMAIRAVVVAVLFLSVPACAQEAGGIRWAGDPPDMSVVVGAGTVVGDNGEKIRVAGTKLTFDPPERREAVMMTKAPRDYADWFAPWEPWPEKGQGWCDRGDHAEAQDG